MAKRYIPLRLKDENDNEVILQFRLGPRAVANYQAISGKNLNDLADIGINDMVLLLYAGCKDMHKDLTVDKMWELIDNFELDELNRLTEQIFPRAEEETDPNAA